MVQETYNYIQFKFGKYNRDIKESALARIEREYKKNGWKKHPIIVNQKMEVLDGQHRLTFAMQHKLPVYYVVVDGLTVEDCVIMNNVRTSWAIEDYIKLYAAQGNEDYIRLQKLLKEYTFAPATTVCAIVKGSLVSGTSNSKLKSGTYKFTEQEYDIVKRKLDFLDELAPYIKAVKGRQTGVWAALSFCYDHPDIDNSRLKKQVKEKIATIIPPANLEIAVKEIERIYNYKIGKERYRYIYTEYQKYSKEKQAYGERNTFFAR